MKKDKFVFREMIRIPIKDHPYAMLILFFCMVLGIAAGYTCISALKKVMGEAYFASISEVCPAISLRGLLHQLILNTALYLLISVSGIWIPGIILTIIGIILKGFFIGIEVFAVFQNYALLQSICILLIILMPECITVIILFNIVQKCLQMWLTRTNTYLKGNTPAIAPTALKSILDTFKAFLFFTAATYFIFCGGMRLIDIIFDAASGK